MKNKSTLKFHVFFLSCFFSLFVNAQEKSNSKKDLFQLEVVEYSAESDTNKPSYHILSLQNNSNKKLTIDLSTIVEYTNDPDKKNSQNINIEILSKDLNKSLNFITLSGKRSMTFKVKISNHPNARLGSMNICKVIARSHNSSDKETIKINAYIPDPNKKGH